MITNALIFNTSGVARLAVHYVPTSVPAQSALLKSLYRLLSTRPVGSSSFLPYPKEIDENGQEIDNLDLDKRTIVYRNYATLFFVFVIDEMESELGILDLIQVFVEALDKIFDTVCELDLVFHFDRVFYIIGELIQGGIVLDISLANIVEQSRIMEAARLKSIQEKSSSLPDGLAGLRMGEAAFQTGRRGVQEATRWLSGLSNRP